MSTYRIDERLHGLVKLSIETFNLMIEWSLDAVLACTLACLLGKLIESSIARTIDKSIHCSIDLCIMSRSIDSLTDWLISQLDDHWFIPMINRSVNWSVDPSIARSAHSFMDWSIDLSIDYLIDLSINWFIDWFEWLINCLSCPFID